MANVCAGISTVAQKPLFENISVLGITSWTVIISFLIISLGIPFFEVTNMEYYTMSRSIVKCNVIMKYCDVL